MFTQNFKFSTCFPHVHPCSFYMQDAYEFLNEKLRSEKREKNYFFCKLNIKDGNVFYTDIYTITIIKIFTCLYIKKVWKHVYTFLIKLSATTKQLITMNSICCLKNMQFFLKSKYRDRLDPFPPPVCFHSLFKDPPSPLHNKPFIKKGLLEKMERVNDNGSAFMHLNVKANR